MERKASSISPDQRSGSGKESVNLMKSWYNTENYRCKFVTKTIRIASNT